MMRLALVLGAVLTFSTVAQADVAPPDSCTTAGAACTNAGTSANQAGVCTATTCTRATPSGPMDYACSRCMVSTSTADLATKPTTTSDGSCNASGQGAGTTALLALLGMLGIRRARAF